MCVAAYKCRINAVLKNPFLPLNVNISYIKRRNYSMEMKVNSELIK